MTPGIKEQLIRDEGWRNRVYKDQFGNETIGVGHNLKNPISDAAVSQILSDDIVDVVGEISETLLWAKTLDEIRFAALVNLVFNMGIGAVLKFEHMLDALEKRDYKTASAHLLNSDYAQQVPNRAHRLAKQIETGKWQ